jgi:hypothetical protein
VQVSGDIETARWPFSTPDVKDTHFIIRDGQGRQVIDGKIEVLDDKWTIVLPAKDLPGSLLRSYTFDLSVYLQGHDGRWSMNRDKVILDGAAFQDYIDMCKRKQA